MKTNEMTNNLDETDKALQDIVELSILFDFYGELFSDHKKEIFGEYIMNDLSLSEIAEETGISRQGVHDIIKRCSAKLREYEDKLGLRRRFEVLKADVSEMKALTAKMKDATDDATRKALTEQITALTDELMNQL